MSSQRSHAIADGDGDEGISYRFKVLLPNSTTVPVMLTNPGSEMTVNDFIKIVRDEYVKIKENGEIRGKKRKTMDWDSAALSCLDFDGGQITYMLPFQMLKPDVCHIIRINDGPRGESILYENMWDLTPETELLRELPKNYGFETAISELIDNSLEAIWSCSPGDRRVIRVSAVKGRFSVFDSGPGMDSSTIDKWGKIGASAHRTQISEAIGCNPPYLMPFFGMFGYGAPYACMFLGRRTLLSTKTKESNKVLILQLDQDALTDNGSVSGINWKAAGGMRDPSEEEMKLSPHGSFTKVEIFDWKCQVPNIKPFQRKLQDIYFPYIQCDELSTTGKIERPVEFWVGKENLAEISCGVVATTNLNSRGHEFWFQIRFINTGTTVQEAHARLKFAYFPILQGKESIDIVLENLEKDVIEDCESFQTFRRIFVRRLGRLLPEVSWASIPFMERGARATTLQKCCGRVICFVDLDAGFDPTPSKTDLASHNAFTVALKTFGSKSKEKDNDVQVEIHRKGTCLRYGEVEQSYQKWVLEMHKAHDVEDASGEDEATIVFDSLVIHKVLPFVFRLQVYRHAVVVLRDRIHKDQVMH